MTSMVVAIFLSVGTPKPVHSLASPGVTAVNLDSKLVDSFTLHFNQQLVRLAGVQVITAQEVATMLGMERQKELLGCSEGASACQAELAAALGVDGVITGSISKVGSGLLINLKLLRVPNATAIAVYSQRVKTEDEALDYLEACAREFAAQNKGEVVAPAEARPAARSLVAPIAVGAVGVAGVAVGVVFEVLAQGTAASLREGGPQTVTTPGDLQALRNTGSFQEAFGYASIGVGAGLITTAVILFVVGRNATESPTPSVGFVPTLGGGVMSIGGSF
jgi:TolB-like protein